MTTFDRHFVPQITVTVKGLPITDGLRVLCDSFNDKDGRGGKAKVARLLDWHYSTLWRKLNGKSQITKADELAIRQVLASVKEGSGD